MEKLAFNKQRHIERERLIPIVDMPNMEGSLKRAMKRSPN
jgi:hypothetical protein